jgi:hypothetical protein
MYEGMWWLSVSLNALAIAVSIVQIITAVLFK